MQERLSTLLTEDYASAIILLIIITIGLLFYLTIHYKKTIKKRDDLLTEKDDKIKSLRQYSYEMELKRVDREHEVEKEILKLHQTIKELETKQKEGLKSQVINMIESYEKKRAQQLDRAGINR